MTTPETHAALREQAEKIFGTTNIVFNSDNQFTLTVDPRNVVHLESFAQFYAACCAVGAACFLSPVSETQITFIF